MGPASLKSLVDKVELSVDGETTTFVIKATRDWTAQVTPKDSGFEVYPLSGKGSNDPQTITVTAGENTERIRSAVVTFTSASLNPLKITLSQNGRKGDLYPVSEVRACKVGSALPAAKLKVQVLSDLSLGNVAKKNLYVQDNTGGIQFRLSAAHEFQKGDSLLIDLENTKLSEYNGLLQIEIDNKNLSKFDSGKPLVAKNVSVKDFMESAYEGQYIALDGVQVVESELEKNYIEYSSSTNILLESERTEELPGGKRFYIYSYHDESIEGKTLTETKVPQQSGTIKGIASRSGDKMQLILTSLADVEAMTQERFEPSAFVGTDATSYKINGDAGSFKISVTSNTEWTLAKDDDADWLTLSSTSGNGNAEITVGYQAYDNTDERTAKLTFSCASGLVSVNVIQKKVEELTLEQFAALADDSYKSDFYRISGSITGWYTTSSIKETQSKNEGYFNIVDASGVEVLIYGCKASIASVANDFGTLGLGIGDFVTLEGTKYSYDGKPRARASYLISYEKTEAITTIAQAITANKAAKLELSGKVMAVSKTGFVLSDGIDAIYVYTGSVPTVAAGDLVDVNGFKDNYGDLPEVTSPTVEKTGTEPVVHAQPKDLSSGDGLSEYYSNWEKIEYVKVAGTADWDEAKEKLYIVVDGTDKKAVSYSPMESYSMYDGLALTIYGYSASVYEETGSLQIVIDKVEAPSYLVVEEQMLSVSASATAAEFLVNSNVAWTMALKEACDWVTSYTESGDNDGKITVALQKNEATQSRTAVFVVSADGLAPVEITLVQNEKVEGGVVDVIDKNFAPVSGNAYKEWSGKSGISGAEYAGMTLGTNYIQLQASKKTVGIVSTKSGGLVKKVVITWNSQVTSTDRKIYVYGSNTAYASAEDLYEDSKKGTELGNVNKDKTTIEVTGDYAYVGIRSNNTVYIDKIEITWE